MTFEKLVYELTFDTVDAESLLKLNNTIDKAYPQLYEELFNSYLTGIENCIDLIYETATKIYISEEIIGLWFCLKLAVLRMYPEYVAHEIEDEYFIAAVANCHRYIAATKEITGNFGIICNRYVRAISHLIELRAFRIGIFNFEFIKFDSTVEFDGKIIKNGDTCLSLHIPINSDISEKSVEYNFSLAREFFKKHFGMGTPVCQLYSWLIHPSIAECLPDGAKLVNFYKRFSIYEIKNNPLSPIEYVFGVKFAEEYKRGNRIFDSYPEETSLQRSFKERLIKGLPLGTAKGITLL